MKKSDSHYQTYLRVLREELVPAMGCTEPVAIAYACAKARDVLGCLPTKIVLYVSGNIIKNVKSVVVPNTGGMKGIPAAAAIGFAVGDAKKKLQVISQVTDRDRSQMQQLLSDCPITIHPSESEEIFEILVEAYTKETCVRVRIIRFHTNIVLVEKNGQILEEATPETESSSEEVDLLTVKDILDFADTADLNDVKEILNRQIRYNTAIKEEGLTGKWGAAIGATLLENYGQDVSVRARAAAVPCLARLQSSDHPFENRNRSFKRLLWRCQCRMCCRRCNCLSPRRWLQGSLSYTCQQPCDRFRNCL